MWIFSIEFNVVGGFAGEFRVRSTERKGNWREDVASRMAVVETKRNGEWMDFMTIREDDVEIVNDAIAKAKHDLPQRAGGSDGMGIVKLARAAEKRAEEKIIEGVEHPYTFTDAAHDVQSFATLREAKAAAQFESKREAIDITIFCNGKKCAQVNLK